MKKPLEPLRLEEIIATAARLMSEKGYTGTSLQEIATKVGIHKSTLFHYFRKKRFSSPL